jgi:hypothetical protein
MGQQQLLLLVLATVIVGLATVAGIQAFSENQQQAAQDALVQRGTEIVSDIKGLQGKPTQIGGIDLTVSNADDVGASTVLNRLGYETDTGNGIGPSDVPVDGAPGSSPNGSGPAECTLSLTHGASSDTPNATLTCDSSEAPQTVTVNLDLDADPQVTTDFS